VIACTGTASNAVMQTEVGERFGVVLGADGLDGPRSGVGRVTVELAHALCGLSAVAELGC
jgi:hypothetical protein